METSVLEASKYSNETLGERLVTVQIGQETYGIPIELVESVVRWETLTRLPRLPRSVAGILNLRGQVIPIIDLRIRLEIPAEACGPDNRIVITRSGNLQVGWIVDAVREVIWAERSLIETKVPLVSERAGDGNLDKGAYLRGVANLPQGFIILLDIENLVADKERAQLAKLETRAA